MNEFKEYSIGSTSSTALSFVLRTWQNLHMFDLDTII